MDDLPSSLKLQQNSARARTGEELETLGKEAASRYVRGGSSSMTHAVVETVKSAGLSPEQVRRVVEFANIDGFHQEFRKEGSGHKVVEFRGGPAVFADVLRDLNDGGTTVMDKHAHDYSTPPPDVFGLTSRNADRLGLESEKLAEAFGVQEVQLPFADPLRPAFDMKDKLAGMEQDLASQLSTLEEQFLYTTDGLFDAVKQASMDGLELGAVISAWHQVTGRPEFVKQAFVHLTPRLLENRVFSSKEEMGNSLTKVASGLLNMQHPIVIHFTDFCELLTKMAEARLAKEEVGVELDKITTFLKAASVGDLAEAGAGMAKKLWSSSTAAAAGAAPQVGNAVRQAGQVAGNVAEAATPYLPHAAVGYGALQAYDAANQSPTVQKAMSYVPGTHQNEVRKYYQQQGA